MQNRVRFGVMLAALAGVFWGSMGVSAQFLFTDCGFRPIDLVGLRLIGAGLMMLLIHRVIMGGSVFKPVSNRRNAIGIFIYGIGMLMAQLCFFSCIRESNAGTATILVATTPLFIILWEALVEGRHVSAREIFCFTLASVGITLIVTKGDFSSLSLSLLGVAGGLASAVFSAFCTLQPRGLISRIGVVPLVGWGLLAGGISVSCIFPPWESQAVWSPAAFGAYAVVVLIGTVGAFWAYFESTRWIPASTVGLLTCFEPLTACLLSVLLLGVSFGAWEAVGAACVLCNVILLSSKSGGSVRQRRRSAQKDENAD